MLTGISFVLTKQGIIICFCTIKPKFWSYNRELHHFGDKNPIFTVLKKTFTILIVLFGLSLTSFAQIKPAIEQEPAKVVKFYPNPATTAINFELPKGYDKSYTIQLFNFMGKKVAEINASSARLNYSLDGFYRGIYIFQLRDKYGKVIDSGKFQVVR
jgi:Secretion system C-terminal sorting domain